MARPKTKSTDSASTDESTRAPKGPQLVWNAQRDRTLALALAGGAHDIPALMRALTDDSEFATVTANLPEKVKAENHLPSVTFSGTQEVEMPDGSTSNLLTPHKIRVRVARMRKAGLNVPARLDTSRYAPEDEADDLNAILAAGD